MKLSNPLLIGFGIGNNNTYKTACKYSSGVIIGSAFIKHIEKNGVKNSKYFISEITE
jgi:tryptophan synthase alpha chain